jgi:(2R)-3-sulfolactate dehydrogenase (NADP+)
MAILSIQQAEALAAQALQRCRTSEDNAASTARAVVAAEADGLKGHGLSRVPLYAAQSKVGKVDGFAVPRVEQRRPGVIAVDACLGFAYPALDAAIAALEPAARAAGLAAASISRSHHCGAAGHPVERLAQAGFVALLFANTPAAMAPWGGSKAVFGTNPIAFACPLAGAPAIVIDLALSKVARGNILAAKQKGQSIPDDWALDAEGKPTTDPERALRGTMVALGGAKGAALALMVELLAAALTGANFAAEASSFLDAAGPPPGTGQLLIAIDPGAFAANAIMRFGTLAQAISEQPGARLPGARRLAARAKAAREGLVVADELLGEIERTG